MPRSTRLLFLSACLSLTLAVMLSAWGAHGLAADLSGAQRTAWSWANQFHFYHSLGLLMIGVLLERAARNQLLLAAAGLMLSGLLLFCGSLYLRVLGAPDGIGAAAPYGGGCFMLAWLLTGIATFRDKSARAPAA